MVVIIIDLGQSALTTTGKSIMINDVPVASPVVIQVSFQYIVIQFGFKPKNSRCCWSNWNEMPIPQWPPLEPKWLDKNHCII